MNRRDFLLLRREREERIVELSCQTLYMRFLDAQITGAEPTEDGDAPDSWGREPPAVLDVRTTSHIFEEISFGLEDADVLRLVGTQWIRSEELSRQLDHLKAHFIARGGRIEIASS